MIERLIHLVQRKNDINRRRRRFYFYWICAAPRNRAYKYCKSPRHISEAQAISGYRRAQSDMKAMKHILTELRREIGAKFIWNAGGMIQQVEHEGARIHHREFKRISDDYLADRYILGAE